MQFNSWSFLLFLPAAYLVVWRLGTAGLRAWFLLAASVLFYAAFDARMALLMVLSCAFDHPIARAVERMPRSALRDGLTAFGVAGNLSLLAVMKYADFATHTANDVVALLGGRGAFEPPGILLPAGISFFTFQKLSYIVDVYRGEIPAERSFVRYAAYIAFFPQLVAGPIVRAASFLPQLAALPAVDGAAQARGLYRVVKGLLKKTLLADPLSVLLVDGPFADPDVYSSVEVAAAVYAYAFQIYLDFSAYTDIAVGSGAMLGYTLPENFARPYLSCGMQEFWRRWHITLSTWLRDYLYIPLGGSRGGSGATARNLFITMLLGGLWHGAEYTFVAWGALHGVALVCERAAGARFAGAWRPLGVLLTFHFVLLAWIPFRAADFATVFALFGRVAALDFSTAQLSPAALATLAIAVIFHIVPVRWGDGLAALFVAAPAPLRGAAVVAVAAAAHTLGTAGPVPFVYFRF